MKKSILVFSTLLLAGSITAFGYMNWNKNKTIPEKTSSEKILNPVTNTATDLDLFYKVDSRFLVRVTKEQLHNAKSIIDILPEKATKSRTEYGETSVTILDKNQASKVTEIGKGELLNDAQIKLLQSADYSTNIRVNSACFFGKSSATGELQNCRITYYITIVPEKKAVFTDGQDALIEYLKENSKDKTSVIQKEQLKPGKVNFTVSKTGEITNVELSSTSGYFLVDMELVQLITNMPRKWKPATNSKGEKVDQEFVFFFGLEGC